MWDEKELVSYGFNHFALGNFSEGIQRLISLLENPNKIPRIYTFGNKNKILLEMLKPETDADELTVRDFRGLIKVLDYCENLEVLQNMEDMEVQMSFVDNRLVTKYNLGEEFLSLYVGCGKPSFCLRFCIGQKNGLYTAESRKRVRVFIKNEIRY